MDDVKVEQIYLEDGREAERHVRDDGEEKVLELYVAPPKPEKSLAKRVVEKKRPVVYERVIETVEGGEVVDRKVEALDPKVEMKLLEHHVAAQAHGQGPGSAMAPQLQEHSESREQYVTKDDLQKALLTVVKAVRKQEAPEEAEEPARQAPEPRLSMQQVVGERVEQSKTASVINIGLAVLIAAQVGALGYLLFFM